jgi:glycosyltransferase involved in cell wall biosynthesis
VARILQVCNTDFYLGKFLSPLVLELASRKHLVECVCEGSSIDPRLAAAGVAVHDFSFPGKGSPLAFIAAIRRMRALLRRGNYDCVDSHNRNASIVARVAAWLERVPVNLYTAHGFYFHDGQSAWLRELTMLLEAALGRFTTCTLSQSAEDVAIAIRRGLVPAQGIVHIGNGIDIGRFWRRSGRTEIESRLGLGTCGFRIATTGRMVKGKGFEDLLRAYAAFAHQAGDSELLMIGGNIAQDIEPFQREFSAEVEALGLGAKVRITGMVDNVEEYLAASDLFVLPSYREGMPRSLIEAMAMGLPCIATDIRGCREIVANGVNGLLYPAGQVNALSQLIAQCWRDRGACARLGASARETAVRDFNESAYVSKQISAIERLLQEAGRAL